MVVTVRVSPNRLGTKCRIDWRKDPDEQWTDPNRLNAKDQNPVRNHTEKESTPEYEQKLTKTIHHVQDRVLRPVNMFAAKTEAMAMTVVHSYS